MKMQGVTIRRLALVGVLVVLAVVPMGVVVAYQVAHRGPSIEGKALRPADAVPTDTVEIRDYAFSPAVIRVQPGTTVTWVNRDAAAHSVVALDGSWETALLQSGESAQHTFEAEGVYRYRCGPHPAMQGMVLVGDAPAPAVDEGRAWQGGMADMTSMMQAHHGSMAHEMDPQQCEQWMRETDAGHQHGGMMDPGDMMNRGSGRGMMDGDGMGPGMMGDGP